MDTIEKKDYIRKSLDNSEKWNEYLEWIEESRIDTLCKLAKDFEYKATKKSIKKDNQNCRI